MLCRALRCNSMSKKSRQKRTRKPPSTVLPAEGYVRLPAVLAAYPVSERSWWSGIQAGRYPKPVKLSARIVAWRVEQIRALLSGK
jgi:prophage regulatory protein